MALPELDEGMDDLTNPAGDPFLVVAERILGEESS